MPKTYTEIFNLEKDDDNTNYDVMVQSRNMDKLENTLSGKLTTERIGKDSNDIYTEIRYKRQDGTLFKKSVLSGGVSPKYTTRTVTFYSLDGITESATQIYTLNYTGDDLTSEVIQ